MTQIDDNILSVLNCIFKDREKWKYVSDEQKEKYCFITNRFFSKKFPHHSLCLNLKEQDKSVIMDMWFHYMKDKPYPKWFWSKSPKFSKTDLEEKDFKLLMRKLDLNKEEDLFYLLENYPDTISEELKWYKKKEKNGKD